MTSTTRAAPRRAEHTVRRPQSLERSGARERVMRERTALDDQLKAIGRIEQDLDDQVTLIELGDGEKDDKTSPKQKPLCAS